MCWGDSGHRLVQPGKWTGRKVAPRLRDHHKAATRGGQMVKRLLNFARSTPVEEVAVDLNTVILEVARLLERTRCPGSTWISTSRPASADPGRFRLPGPPGHEPLRQRGRRHGGQRHPHPPHPNLDADSVLVAVADTGSGMAREVLDRPWTPSSPPRNRARAPGWALHRPQHRPGSSRATGNPERTGKGPAS